MFNAFRGNQYFPMCLFKTTVLAATMIFYASCTKTDTSSNKATNTTSCFSTNSTENGKLIEGQYIISFKITTAASAVSNEDIKRIAREMILGGKVSEVKASFNGGGGGV